MPGKRKSVLVVGNFGYKTNQEDGQTIKTRNIYSLIKERHCGAVSYVDTSRITSVITLARLLFYSIVSDVTIIIPASKALEKLFPPLYYITKWMHHDLIHLGVGGWQLEFFKGEGIYRAHPHHVPLCKAIKSFMLEIKNVETSLKQEFNFSNTCTFPNFRSFTYTPKIQERRDCLRLVFMARIMQMKGYDVVFDLMTRLNKRGVNISVDFYGPLIAEDATDFLAKVTRCPNARYIKALSPEEIYPTLSDYDIMLFPTRYYTEGFPGTVLDAYIAGIPVIATEWKHSHEFIKDGETGFIVPFDDPLDKTEACVMHIYSNPHMLRELKEAAHNESKQYSEDAAWEKLAPYL